jgi:hypothetical protein
VTGTFSFEATVWEHDGDAAWHFVSLPEDVADEIAERSAGRTRGFGSVRVEVTIGASTWRTSLFPDGRRGTYVLPVKTGGPHGGGPGRRLARGRRAAPARRRWRRDPVTVGRRARHLDLQARVDVTPGTQHPTRRGAAASGRRRTTAAPQLHLAAPERR